MQHGVLKKFGLLLALLPCAFAQAQQDSVSVSTKAKAQPAFQLVAAAGLLAGASGHDVQLQIIPALRYKTVSVGVGSGLDYYYQRTIPLFADVRKVFQNPMLPFLYADAGWNFPWIKEDKTNIWLLSCYKAGLYYDFGAGYNFKINKQHAIVCSVGYSTKRLTELQTWRNPPPGTDEKYYTTKMNYDLRRLSFKVGFRL